MTLIEVLVALGIMVVLGAGMFSFLHDLRVRHQRLSETSAAQRAAAALIDGLERDLATATVVSGNQPGIVGAPESVQIRSRGVALSLESSSGDDRIASAYTFDAGAKALSVSRSGHDQAAVSEVIAEGTVHRVSFRYHNGSQWLSRFNSEESNEMPVAVEVAVWLHEPIVIGGSPEGLDEPLMEEGFAAFPEARLTEDPADVDWGQPDRVRVIAIPRLGSGGGRL